MCPVINVNYSTGRRDAATRPSPRHRVVLLYFPATLLPVAFAGQRLLGPELLTRLQVKGVSFDLFNNVLLLDLTLEATKGVFQSFALLKLYFCQTNCTS